MPTEEDSTIRLVPGQSRLAPVAPPTVTWGEPPPHLAAPPPRRRAWPVALVAVLAGGVVGGAWWNWQSDQLGAPVVEATPAAMAPVSPVVPAPLPAVVPPAPVLAPLPVPAQPPVQAPAPAQIVAPATAPPSRLGMLPPLMEEAAMAEHRAGAPTLLRLAGNPAVFLLDFPSLDEQGSALNRVAALVEKAGLPRDRVLTEAEMAAAIAAAGDTPATYYYGHNYRGSELARFFELARRDGLALSAGEAWVETQYLLARGLVPAGQEIAIISIAASGARMDASARASILRHELSHGLFATRPAYAAHIREVWEDRFTEVERAAFRAFLAREGYDATIEPVMVDEAQAYLLHTPDPRFFNAALLGMTEAEVTRLRALMRDGAPFLE